MDNGEEDKKKSLKKEQYCSKSTYDSYEELGYLDDLSENSVSGASSDNEMPDINIGQNNVALTKLK
eukprot:CAMPEP_0170542664 /NCGR_PEP_ID=MMETSP0211-20121228/2031_1 /TAXON_ID=311385 /ORGANISM="Pseudokeronopsis sp., Strain OXSARD2" /LENGTH=65 /DNA_ID=CAMNT_0010845813 /DNA_START=280 /DNA_END=477 /DNA_ORIENTATION=-